MNTEQLMNNGSPYLQDVVSWRENVQVLPISDVIQHQLKIVAVISVDAINGFWFQGPLSRPRVAGIV